MWMRSPYCESGQCVEVFWRKASYSHQNGGCVEVGTMAKSSHSLSNGSCVEAGSCVCGGDILVRDTKDKGNGPVLRFTPAEWDAFLKGVKDGEFG